MVGLSLAFLMIVTGLVAGLILMDMKIKNLAKDLKSEKTISQGFKAQNQNLSNNLDHMTNALSVAEFEIEGLKQDIQSMVDENQQNLGHTYLYFDELQKLHQSCSKELELSSVLIEDLKLQNQNLTKDLVKIDSAKESLTQSIPDQYKNQQLCRESSNGDVIKVKLFLKLGANVNETCDGKESFLQETRNGYKIKEMRQNSPLHYAALSRNFEIAELLLRNGADVNATNNLRMTPLQFAARKGHPKMVELFLNHGASKESKDIFGWTPLMEAERIKNKHDQLGHAIDS